MHVSIVKEVGIGPPSGTFREYKCHPESILALNNTAPLSGEMECNEISHLTGEKI
jgi:hypothetical protein